MDERKVLLDLFKAYYSARSNKRGTRSAITFEMNYERNLLQLGREIAAGTYTKEYLKSIIPRIRQYLHAELSLELHPKKIYLQDFHNGVSFLGAIIKPYRMYVCNRTKGNFYKKIQQWNRLLAENESGFPEEHQRKFVASMNSHLGLAGHFHTYKLRRKMLTEQLSPDFKKIVQIAADYDKIIGCVPTSQASNYAKFADSYQLMEKSD